MVKQKAFVSLLFLLSPLLHSSDLTTGFIGMFNLGMGSGKGLWDTTDPRESGKLSAMPGGGISYLADIPLSYRTHIKLSIQYSYAQAGQKAGDQEILYTQQSLELPVLLMGTPLSGESRLTLGAGPSVTVLPAEAVREVTAGGTVSEEAVEAEQTVLIGIQAGADYTIPLSSQKDLILTFRFSHPFTSPVYDWGQGGSGNIRINRIDLGIGVLSRQERRRRL